MSKHRVAILGLLLSSAAQAAPVTFDLTGTVTQAANTFTAPAPGPVMVGEQIPIVITIDDAYQPDVLGGGTYSFSGGSPARGFGSIILSASFAGMDNNGFFQTVVVTPDSGISLIAGNSQTSSGFSLALSGAVAGALPTTALPSALDASEFTAGTFSVTELFSSTTNGFSGVIDGLAGAATTVPEPATWAVLVMGLAGLAWLRPRAGRTC